MCRLKEYRKLARLLLGYNFKTISDVNGANKAVSASNMGAKTIIVGFIDQDIFGSSLIISLKDTGVDIRR